MLSKRLNLLLLVLFLFPLNASAQGLADWPEGSAEADDGATRDYYNRGAGLAWRQLQGDWLDRGLVLHGDNHWSSATVEDTDSGRYIDWDVGDLVEAWLDSRLFNQGFYLHADSSGRNLIFSSRQGPEGQHPQLVVEDASGVHTLSPEADATLPESTYQAQGLEPTLEVGEHARSILRFDLSSVQGPITSATLRLYTTTQYDTIDVAVDAVVTGRIGDPPALQYGLAQAYDSDLGIEAEANVIMHDDFEGDSSQLWTSMSGFYEPVEAGVGDGFEPLNGRAMRMTLTEGDNYGGSLIFDFGEELGDEPDSVYMRYYLRLGESWDPSYGGKLPGLAGTYDTAGWGGRPSDGTNGWSARGLFQSPIPETGSDNPLMGYTPIGSYVYHADMEGSYGDNFLWIDAWGHEGYGGLLERNRWYCVEVYAQMNTGSNFDGVLMGWIDGRKSLEKTDLRFRTVDTLHIQRVWMNVFHGGTAVAPSTQHLYFDNVVIAANYIGPMGNGGSPPEELDPAEDTGGVLDADSADTSDISEDLGHDYPDPELDLQDAGDAGNPEAADANAENASDDGCSCSLATPRELPFGAFLLLLPLLVWVRRRW